jgi:hypothetical protein
MNDGVPVMDGESLVWIDEAGNESPFKPDVVKSRLSAANKEAQTYREEKERLERELKDRPTPDRVKELQEELEALRAKGEGGEELAEQMAKLEATVAAQTEELEKVKAEASTSDGTVREMLVERPYLTSPLFVAQGDQKPLTTLLPDFAKAQFSQYQRVEDGVVVTYDKPVVGFGSGEITNGAKPIRSKNPDNEGAIAGFDEALTILIKSRPDANRIIGPSGAGGGGGGGSEDGPGGGNTIARAEFDKMSPAEQMSDTREVVDG